MVEYRRLVVTDGPGVVFVRFKDSKILDEGLIQAIGGELELLKKNLKGRIVVFNLAAVEFPSLAFLGKLILFHKWTEQVQVSLRLCDLRSGVQEVFRITRLNQLFEIFNTEADALAQH